MNKNFQFTKPLFIRKMESFIFLSCALLFGCTLTHRQSIYDSSQSGDIKQASPSLKDDICVKKEDTKKKPSLHSAIINNNIELVFHMIKNGSNVNEKDSNGSTPLILASEKGYLKIASILIKNKAYIHITNKDGDTALHQAIWHNHTRLALFLIKNSVPIINLKGRGGYSSLSIASAFGNIQIVSSLIKYGAIINNEPKNGVTPLHHASFGTIPSRFYPDYLEVISLLLKSGLDINEKDSSGQTPLHHASNWYFPNPSKHNKYLDKLTYQSEQVKVMNFLIKNGANVNAKDSRGITPLHHASSSENLKAISFLIKSGAKVNSKNQNGVTPLHMATAFENPKAVFILIRNGANVNAKTTSLWSPSKTPLIWASQIGARDVASLLAKKSDINLKNQLGRSALHYASEHGNLDIVSILIKYGANINTKDIKGVTPLSLAKKNKHKEIVNTLCLHGAK